MSGAACFRANRSDGTEAVGLEGRTMDDLLRQISASVLADTGSRRIVNFVAKIGALGL